YYGVISIIKIDKRGNIWFKYPFGTLGKYIIGYADTKKDTVSIFTEDTEPYLLEDKEDNIRLATNDSIIPFHYDSNQFLRHSALVDPLFRSWIWEDAFEDSFHRLWLRTSEIESLNIPRYYDPPPRKEENFIYQFSVKENSYKKVQLLSDEGVKTDTFKMPWTLSDYTNFFFEDSKNQIWLLFHSGLYKYDEEVNTFEKYHHQNLNSDFFRDLAITSVSGSSEGNLFFAGLNKPYSSLKPHEENALITSETVFSSMHTLNPVSGSLVNVPVRTELDERMLVESLFHDHNDALWLINQENAIYQVEQPIILYYQFPNSGYGGPLFEKNDGSIGMMNYGNENPIFDPVQNQFFDGSHLVKSENGVLMSLTEDKEGYIWFFDNSGFRWRSNQKTNQIQRITIPSSLDDRDPGDFFFTDQSKNIWLRQVFGLRLYLYDFQSQEFELFLDIKDYVNKLDSTYSSLKSNFRKKQYVIGDIREDGAQNIWVYIWDNDYVLFHVKISPDHKKDIYINGENRKSYFRHPFEDSQGRKWHFYYDQLTCYDPEKGIDTTWNSRTAFKGGSIIRIQEDHLSNIWVLTRKPATLKYGNEYHIYRISKDIKDLHHFSLSGVAPDELDDFPQILKTQSGDLYIKGEKGLFRITPDKVKLSSILPTVVLTNLEIHNQPVPIRGSQSDTTEIPSPLLQAFPYTKRIELQYDQNDFSIEFAVLNYSHPEQNEYRFRLIENKWEFPFFKSDQSSSKSWTQTNEPLARFNNLPPGNYTFQAI
ncbi:MAG: hypothetical protein KDD63_08130, partial [Bacteroidetes bacterium]|nr:hypothetical protein [Bacteroidota bacterium]